MVRWPNQIPMRARPWRRSAAGLVVAALGATAILGAIPAHKAAAAPGPFACTPGFYQVINGAVAPFGQLKELNPVTVVYTNIGAAYADSYNGMGWNPVDNYMYAIDTTAPRTGTILRIANDGSAVNLGVPSGTYVAGNYNNGDVDPTGHLILWAGATTWYSINLATMVSTQITPNNTAHDNDYVYIGGSMYGLSGNTLTVLNIGTSTSVAKVVTVSGPDPGGNFNAGSFGASWTDLPSELFYSDNNTGHIYKITGFAGAAPTATYIITAAITSNNDGASCPNADSPFNGPVANNDTYSFLAGQTFTATVAAGILANDTGSPPLTVTSNTAPAHGVLTMNANGSFTFAPTPGYSGPDSFTYIATDPYGRPSAPATVTLTILPAPQNFTFLTPLNTGVSRVAPGLLTNAVGSGLVIISNTAVSNGTLTVSANGAFSYTPNLNFSGPDSFQYTVRDTAGQTASGTVTINVQPAPFPDSYTTAGTTPLVVATPGVLVNDIGTALVVSANTAPANGSVAMNANGSFTYTANANFSGTDTFVYTASSSGVTNTATVTITVTPTTSPSSYTTPANITLNVPVGTGVLSVDDGTGLTVIANTNPTHGILTLNANGSFTFVPAAGYSGPDSFTYTARDASGRSVGGSTSLSVTPTAAADAYTVPYGSTLNPAAATGVLSNDIGSGITVFSNTSPAHGTLTVNPNGSFTYTATVGYAGPDSFQYTLHDSSAQAATATVTINDQLPAAPAAVADIYVASAGSALVRNAASGVLNNDTGTGINVTAHTAPTHGTLVIAANGSFTYTPTAGYSGPDSFTYTITDLFGRTSVATVTLTVNPTAVNDSYSTAYGTPLNVNVATGVLSNDLGTGLTVTGHTAPAHGTLVINANGSFVYTPTAGYAGADSFQYTVTDSSADTATATVSLTVNLPAAPVAVNDSYTTAYATTLNVSAASGVLINDTGVSVAVTGNTVPAHGSVVINPNGSFAYVPNAGYAGPDNFQYTIADLFAQTSTATVNLTISLPAAPAANNDADVTTAGSTLNRAAPGVLGNDTGVGIAVTGNTAPLKGVVTVNANGSYSYTPTAGYSGPDSFQYTITDGFARTAVATVSITVNPLAVNDTYVAGYQTALTVGAPSGVLGNDLGTGLAASVSAAPIHGTLTLNANGSFTYTPNAGYAGPDSFTYTATDAAAHTSTATAAITVSLPPAPVANNDAVTTNAGITASAVAPGVLGNDTGTGITVTGATAPTHGSDTVNANGSYSYTPTGGYSGPDSFTYTITDAFGRTSTATFNVTVKPVAVNDAYSAGYQTPLAVASPGVLGNDSGTGLTASLSVGPLDGALALNANGSFTYTPNAGYTGPDSFVYMATDASAATATATVAITVSLPPAPVAVGDFGVVNSGATLTFTAVTGVMSNDSGTGIAVTGNTAPSHGVVAMAANGGYTYTPAVGYSGPDSFTYTITDSFVRTATATVALTVKPVAVADAYVTAYQTPLAVAAPGILNNDRGTALTTSLTAAPTHGSLVLNANGSFTYTPGAGYAGADSFTYTATDASSQTSGAIVNLTVNLPAAPSAINDAGSISAGSTLIRSAAAGVLSNDTGTGISVTANAVPSHGAVTVNPDGSYSYTPTAGYSGPDAFGYTITDSFGRTASATVSITVTPVAVNDAYSTAYQTPLVIAAPGVLGNDSGSSLTATVATGPTHGSLTLNATGSFTYTPNAGYAGADSFTYTATDSTGQTSPATVSLTVSLPAAPVALNDAGTIPAGGTLIKPAPGVLGNDSGTGIAVTGNTSPTHGAVTITSNGAYSYTPTPGYSGADAFTYTITDAFARTATATVSLFVTPVAVNDSYTATYQTALVVAAPGVLGNDSGSSLGATLSVAPTHGSLVLNGDGSFTYTPNSGYAGPDSLTYTATDASAQTTTATVTLTVSLPPVPIANSDSRTITTGSTLTVTAPGVLSNDTGTGITVTGNTLPSNGVLTISGNGAYTYTPSASYSGPDSFTYTITDSFARTSSATVSITVTPVALADSYTTAYQTPLVVAGPGVLGNDSGSGLTASVSGPPLHGALTLNAGGSFTYTPNAGYAGLDSFTYVATDTSAQTASAVVNLTINLPAAPVAVNDIANTTAGTALSVAATGVLSNDTGTSISVTGNTAPGHGAVTVNANGSYLYTPAAGYSGPDSFTYTITDAFGRAASAVVAVSVHPAAVNDAYSTPYASALTVAMPGVLGNDSGTGLATTLSAAPTHGSLTLNADGSFVYTPNVGYAGPDSFTYTATDASAQAATATATITVNAPGAPVAINDAATTPAETPLTVAAPGVLGNDTGTGITVTGHGAPARGALTVSANGSYVYTPPAGYSGPDTFTYTITDVLARTALATVTITVTPVTHAASGATTAGTGPLTVTPPPPTGSGPYTWALVPGGLPPPSIGSVVINPLTGQIVFTPAPGFSGPVPPFDYRITDPTGGSSPGVISLTIIPAAPPFSTIVTDTGASTLNLPRPNGTGPFTWTLVLSSLPPASQGAVSLDPQTGALTFTPPPGFSGPVPQFEYTVADASGTVSAPAIISIGVLAISITVPNTGAAATLTPVPAGLFMIVVGVLLCRGRRQGRTEL